MTHPVVQRDIDLFLASTASRYLRTIYIDPTAANNGDGSTWTQAATPGGAGAFNAWGVGTWTAGAIDLTNFWRDQTRYLQRAETQVNNVVVYEVASAPMIGVLFGTYDPATGAQITDGTRHARIWSASGQALNLGTASTKRQNVVVDNMDCRALARTTTSGFNYGFSNSAAAINTYVGITLIRCIADGYVGITLKGKDLRFYDCAWNGYADGLTAQSVDTQVLGCRLFSAEEFLPIDSTSYDSLSVNVLGAYTAELVRVEYNDFTKPLASDKQAIYLYCGGGTNANTPSGPVTIRYNKVSNANQCIYSALDNTEIAFNWVDQAWNHNYPDGSAGDPRAMTVIANGAFVHDNLVTNSPFAIAVSLASTAGTARVHRNTFDGVEMGVSATSGTYTLDWRDNVCVRSPQTAVIPDADCLYVKYVSSITWASSNNVYYGAADPATPFFAASVNRDFAAYQSAKEPTARFVAPGYDASYRATSGGNLDGAAGTTGWRDMAGIARKLPTSPGAYEAVDARLSRVTP